MLLPEGVNRVSIRARLFLLTGGLVIPLVLAGFYNLWSAWHASQRQLNEAVERQAEFAATAFEQWLEAQKQTLTTIKDLSENNQSPLTLKDYLNSIVKTRPHWLDVQIVSAAGEVRLSQSTKDRPLPLTTIEIIRQEVDQKEEMVVFTEQIGDRTLRLLSLAQPIRGGDFVVARIDGTTASRVFERLQLPEDYIIAVFDARYRLLYRNRVSPEQMSLDVSDTPLISALQGKQIASIEVESPYDNIKRVYGLARVEGTNSIVVVGVPSSNLYQPAAGQFLNHLLFGLLITVLAMAAAYLIARSITNPINNLERTARDFGAGNFTARTDNSQTGAIRELGLTFNRMAEQIAEREEKLKALDRLKSDFVNSVSHELRTPLTTIKTLVHVLRRGRLPESENDEYLRTIDFECGRQIDLIQNLLDLSRIESGAYRTSFALTDVGAVLREALRSQKAAAEVKGIALEYDDRAGRPSTISTDRIALLRIVSTLLENSIKYTPENGRIELSVENGDDALSVKLIDDGCGIAEDDLPHVFEKFFRGRPLPAAGREAGKTAAPAGAARVNETSGVGLGLYIVKNLAEQIGGRITVASPPRDAARGTELTLILPNLSSELSENTLTV
jgi:signal transduction histidine kinase